MSTTYSPTGTSITDYSSTQFSPGDIIIGKYSGAVNPIKLPVGNYKLECWGAYGGSGGTGTVTFTTTKTWNLLSSDNFKSGTEIYFVESQGSSYDYSFSLNEKNQWVAENLGVNSSEAEIYLLCYKKGTYRITYYYNTETNYDKVTMTWGGTTILSAVSGNASNSVTVECSDSDSGSVALQVIYSKDSSQHASNENVYFTIEYQKTERNYSLLSSSSTPGGKGGYSTGILALSSPTNLYLYVGGKGEQSLDLKKTENNAGGFNGGGSSKIRYGSSILSSGGGGGGASDIRIGQDSLYARVIVAGGGGGGAGEDFAYSEKAGGGENGLSQVAEYQASQTAAGTNGSFGQGANATGSNAYNYGPGGGGGGWYGGGASTQVSNDAEEFRTYNGGGSGYVYTSSTASNYPSGCLLNSNYYLINAFTQNGTTNTNLNPDLVLGYIRITVLSPLNIKIDSSTYALIKAVYIKTDDTTWKGGDVTWLPTI